MARRCARQVSEADRTMKLRLPVRAPLKPGDFPKMDQLSSYAMVATLAASKLQSAPARARYRHPSQQTALADPTHTACFECGGTLAERKVCAKCKVARYCSKECQTAHWRSHKALCKKLCAAAANAP